MSSEFITPAFENQFKKSKESRRDMALTRICASSINLVQGA